MTLDRLDESPGSAAADEDLIALVYSSSATASFDDERLRDLLMLSREANADREITGMLLYRRGRFIQFLEGPGREVRDLLDSIAADGRHTDVRVLLDHPLATRQFPDWTMGYEPVAEIQETLPEGFRSTFDDLEDEDDPESTLRAARELTLLFRVRSAAS